MKRSRGERRGLPARGGQRLPDVVLRGSGGVAVPDREGKGGRPVPHRPVPARALSGRGARRADPPVRRPGSVWVELPRPVAVGAGPVAQVRIAYARASTVRQSLDTQLDSLKQAGVTRVFSEKISTRAMSRPELDKAVVLARELRASGVSGSRN